MIYELSPLSVWFAKTQIIQLLMSVEMQKIKVTPTYEVEITIWEEVCSWFYVNFFCNNIENKLISLENTYLEKLQHIFM
jgi:hypothetical protein